MEYRDYLRLQQSVRENGGHSGVPGRQPERTARAGREAKRSSVVGMKCGSDTAGRKAKPLKKVPKAKAPDSPEAARSRAATGSTLKLGVKGKQSKL
jgi:hypothetical protein